MYDPCLVVWYGVDPLLEKNYSLGPYVFCANNPIYHLDTNGREFSDALKLAVEELLRAALKVEQKHNDKIEKQKSKIASGKLKQEGVDRANCKIARHEVQKKEIADMRGELNEMEQSDQKYNIRFNAPSPPVNDDNVYIGSTTYNRATDAVIINVYNSTNVGNTTLAHELKHPYQFETGTLSCSLRSGYSGIYYDYHDEVEALVYLAVCPSRIRCIHPNDLRGISLVLFL